MNIFNISAFFLCGVFFFLILQLNLVNITLMAHVSFKVVKN